MALDQDNLNALKLDKSQRYQRKGSNWGKWLGLFMLAGIFAGAVYWFGANKQAQEMVSVDVHTVSLPKSDATEISDAILNASGYVVARRQATVSSKVTGKILEVMVEEGMQVEAGQVLAELDDSILVAQIALAQSQKRAAQQALAEIQVRVDEAQKNLQRTLSLRERQLVAASAVDTAQAELSALRARLSKARSDIQVTDQNLALQKQYQLDYTIRAPFDGVVISKNAQPGEMISPAATGGSTRTGICTIVDMSSREIEVDVNESFINKVEAGQEVEAILDAYPDWTIPARVINIVPTADRQKATVKVRIGFTQLDKRILTDMGVKVTFLSDTPVPQRTVNSKPQVRIPLDTLYNESGVDKVLLVDSSGKLSSKVVTIASRTLNNAILENGLSGNEQLVIDPEAVKDLSIVSVNNN
ncbi:MAG: efflux RND transporter periplasmic adaptor subunit [Gammaproteobacteria bacterium]|nr:efflux RND transporter periplasmic adaptor subunit [Gammaproteobacteria bacterium]NNC98238.1 efflux RND transporter periplasmic adaptor subunit [Gammaproteobacteria bacterium]NNM13876.1 efflux RND transporter periplasmic adaptor subunit [Gammaproteobacteria bacterium]